MFLIHGVKRYASLKSIMALRVGLRCDVCHDEVMMMMMIMCGDGDDVMVVAETERRVKANHLELNATFNYAVSRRRYVLSYI